MNETYSKHYIRIDAENRITKGFSDVFEQPFDSDICINEQGGRHFEMLGIVNPPLTEENGVYIYKYEDGMVLERTAEEIQADIANIPIVLSEQEQTNVAIAELTMMVASLL